MNQKRRIVRLNETTLKRIISESVGEALALLKNSDGGFDWYTPEDEPYAVRVAFYGQEHPLSPQKRLVTWGDFEHDIVPLTLGTTMSEVEEMIHEVERGKSNRISDGIVELYYTMPDSQANRVGSVTLTVIDKDGNELGKPVGINWDKVKHRNTVEY